MQENVMSFVNISPLFIAIIIGFVVSFNENTSVKVPAIVVIISTMFVLATMLLSQKMKKWLAWILGLIVGFVWAILLLILLGVTFNI